MPSLERVRPATLIDSVWRMVLRLGFRLARAWWTPSAASPRGRASSNLRRAGAVACEVIVPGRVEFSRWKCPAR